MSTSNSARFSGSVALQLPERTIGPNAAYVHDTMPTTELDAIGDKRYLFPIPNGAEIYMLYEEHADLDSGAGALDMDIVLEDDNGDTILYNAGTAFNAAVTGKWIAVAGTKVKGTTAKICTKIVAAASTPASGSLIVYCFYKT